MTLKAIGSPERVVDGVHAALRDAILSGNLKPESPLSVPELARQLNVSRSPVREAVLLLTADGLAVERPRRGCVVARIGLEDALEIHDMRAALESLATERAADIVSPELLHWLETAIEDQAEAARTGASERFNAADRRFHALLHAAAGNRRLEKTLDSLRAQMEISLSQVALSGALMALSIEEHRHVVDALGSGRAEDAAAAMRRHISATRDRIRDRLADPARSYEGAS